MSWELGNSDIGQNLFLWKKIGYGRVWHRWPKYILITSLPLFKTSLDVLFTKHNLTHHSCNNQKQILFSFPFYLGDWFQLEQIKIYIYIYIKWLTHTCDSSELNIGTTLVLLKRLPQIFQNSVVGQLMSRTKWLHPNVLIKLI